MIKNLLQFIQYPPSRTVGFVAISFGMVGVLVFIAFVLTFNFRK